MAKKPAKTKPAAAPADPWMGMDLNLPEPEGEKAKPTEPSMADVLARMERLETENQSLRTTQTALMTRQPAPAAPVAAEPPKTITFENMPDPTKDAKAYAEEVARRIEARDALARKADSDRNAATQTANQRAEGLWAQFKTDYPELADEPDRVKFIAGQVAQEAHAKGVDLNTYMYTTRDQFMEDVAAKYITVFGDPEEGEDGNEDAAPAEGRTAGIPGGLESGGARSAGPKGGEDPRKPKTDMITDIKTMQKASGYF